ncbi:histidinol-phosphate aminotransferase [Trametopsis cervina]|nr:histidinol-phosphate aminotransferase [Trametopsis cervina]
MTIIGLDSSLYPTKPAHFDIESVIRPNILALHPYRSARDDYSEGVLLDANENALGHSIPSPSQVQDASTTIDKELEHTLDLDLHRYPSPTHDPIKARIAEIRSLPGTEYVFLGVGSDEVIDLLMRVCVAPGKEKILTTPPTYGMYAVCAQVNDVGVVKIPLQLDGSNGEGGESGRFSVKLEEIKQTIRSDPTIKLVFLCSPGNPTGTLIPLSTIRALLDFEEFKGVVVVDEAYVDFAGDNASAASLVLEYANLCVMQTLSKSFGLAAIRLGIAIAHPALIHILMNTKAPYNISTPTASLALSALSPKAVSAMHAKVASLTAGRAWLLDALSQFPELGAAIGSNDANFIMVPVLEKGGSGKPDSVRAQRVYKTMAEEERVVVRYRGNEPGCAGCLRVTIGTAEENKTVVEKLREVLAKL